MYLEIVGRSLEEVEEIFNQFQGHTFSAWKIGKDGKKMLKEVVGKSKDLEVTLLRFQIILS